MFHLAAYLLLGRMIQLDLTSHFSLLWGIGENEEKRERGKMQIKQQRRVTGGPACPGSRVPGPGLGSDLRVSCECPEPAPHLPVPVHAAHPSTRATACNKACHWSTAPVYRGQEPIRAADTLCLWGQQFCDWVWLGCECDALRVQLGRGAAKKRMRGWVAVTTRQWTHQCSAIIIQTISNNSQNN